MKTINIYIAKFFGCWARLSMVALLFVLSGCVHEDRLILDPDVLSDKNKIIMNLHLDLSQEQKEAVETRAVWVEDKEVRDIFVFLFDESGLFRAVEQSIERKHWGEIGSTRFFVAFDKNSIEDVDKLKVVVVANLEKSLLEVKAGMRNINNFDKFIKSYSLLQLDAQSYGKAQSNLLASVFYADKAQLVDLTASLVRPISKFKVSLAFRYNYELIEASLYGYSKVASGAYNIDESNQPIVTPVKPATTLLKPIKLVGTNSVLSASSNSYVTGDYMVVAEQTKDLLVVLKCKNSSGKFKYFSSRISNIEVARNKSYTINFTKLSGEGYATEAEAAVGEELSTSLVVTWDDRIREGYVRQHKYFGVGKKTVKQIKDKASEFSTYIQTNMAFDYKLDFHYKDFKPEVIAKPGEGKLEFYYVKKSGDLQSIPIPILDFDAGLLHSEVPQTVFLQRVALNSDNPATPSDKVYVYKIGFTWNSSSTEVNPENYLIKMYYEGAELMEFNVMFTPTPTPPDNDKKLKLL